MWPLKPKQIVDADTAAWHVENFEWLARQFSENGEFERVRLVLPRPGFFTGNGEKGHALALRLFTQVKHYCEMDEWEVDLVADDNPAARNQSWSFGMVAPRRHALGTFGISGNRIQITYVPALLQRPDQFIATMAHELAHYLLAAAGERPVCEDDERECLTDLAAVFMGFGVFLANARFNMQTYSDSQIQGWRWDRAGYLPEADLIFALALFLRAKELEAEEACAGLKPHLAGLLKRAMKVLPQNHADVARVREALAPVGKPDLRTAT
jgi:hypothetical protein